MDIQAIGKTAAKIAFNAAGNAKVRVFLRSGIVKSYDAATDSQIETGGDEVPLDVIEYLTREQQNVLANQGNAADMVTQKTFLIKADDLPAGVIPKQNDTFVQDSDGSTWNIIAVLPDPARATFRCMVRQ